MGQKWKWALVTAAAIGLTGGVIYATGAAMLLFRPYASATVRIQTDQLGVWKQQVRMMAAERRALFREKSLDRHWGGGEGDNLYTWRQFGFCSLSECLVLSNPFDRSEFNVVIYESRLSGHGSALRSYLESKGVRLHWSRSP